MQIKGYKDNKDIFLDSFFEYKVQEGKIDYKIAIDKVEQFYEGKDNYFGGKQLLLAKEIEIMLTRVDDVEEGKNQIISNLESPIQLKKLYKTYYNYMSQIDELIKEDIEEFINFATHIDLWQSLLLLSYIQVYSKEEFVKLKYSIGGYIQANIHTMNVSQQMTEPNVRLIHTISKGYWTKEKQNLDYVVYELDMTKENKQRLYFLECLLNEPGKINEAFDPYHLEEKQQIMKVEQRQYLNWREQQLKQMWRDPIIWSLRKYRSNDVDKVYRNQFITYLSYLKWKVEENVLSLEQIYRLFEFKEDTWTFQESVNFGFMTMFEECFGELMYNFHYSVALQENLLFFSIYYISDLINKACVYLEMICNASTRQQLVELKDKRNYYFNVKEMIVFIEERRMRIIINTILNVLDLSIEENKRYYPEYIDIIKSVKVIMKELDSFERILESVYKNEEVSIKDRITTCEAMLSNFNEAILAQLKEEIELLVVAIEKDSYILETEIELTHTIITMYYNKQKRYDRENNKLTIMEEVYGWRGRINQIAKNNYTEMYKATQEA